jgi:hypothetical protein
VIPRWRLVSIFVTLTSRVYKGGQGPLQNSRSLDHSTPKGIQTIIQDVGCYAPCGPNLSKSCVSCTFEFLISAFPHPKLTTLGLSLGGQPVKHRHIYMISIWTRMSDADSGFWVWIVIFVIRFKNIRGYFLLSVPVPIDMK